MGARGAANRGPPYGCYYPTVAEAMGAHVRRLAKAVSLAAGYAMLAYGHAQVLPRATYDSRAWPLAWLFAADVLSLLSVVALAARRRWGLSGLMALSLVGIPLDLSVRPLWAVSRAAMLAAVILDFFATNMAAAVLRSRSDGTHSPRGPLFGPGVPETLATVVMELRGLAYLGAGLILALPRLQLGFAWSVGPILWSFIGAFAAFQFVYDRHWPEPVAIGLCVGAGGLVYVVFEWLKTTFARLRDTARVLPGRFLRFAAIARAPRAHVRQNRRADRILAEGRGFTLILRDWRDVSGDLARTELGRNIVPLIADSLARTTEVITIADPGQAWPDSVVSPVASCYWWADSVRSLIAQARSIVVLAKELTDGLRWELDEVRAQGREGHTLLLMLPRARPRASARSIAQLFDDDHDPVLEDFARKHFAHGFLILTATDAKDPIWLPGLGQWAADPTGDSATSVGVRLSFLQTWRELEEKRPRSVAFGPDPLETILRPGSTPLRTELARKDWLDGIAQKASFRKRVAARRSPSEVGRDDVGYGLAWLCGVLPVFPACVLFWSLWKRRPRQALQALALLAAAVLVELISSKARGLRPFPADLVCAAALRLTGVATIPTLWLLRRVSWPPRRP